MMDWTSGQFLKLLTGVLLLEVAFSQDYDYPVYSEDSLPETGFTCEDKNQGGYYADVETDCQMYHVCTKDASGLMKSIRFLCANGTVFDQRKLVCQDYRKVLGCRGSSRYYRLAGTAEVQSRHEKRHQAILRASDFRNDYDYPTYSEADMPQTSFSCEDKRDGGYYADVETDCQMYHVCSRDGTGTRFLCANGTVFDQRKMVCQDYQKVPVCQDSARHFRHAGAQEQGRRYEVRQALAEAAKIDSETERVRSEIRSDYPTYSGSDLPVTSFSCKDKVDGGYYADVEADCQMYHVCYRNRFGHMRGTRFLCGNGTVFDQRHTACQDRGKVRNCQESPRHYRNQDVALELRATGLRADKEILKANKFDSERLK